MTGSTPPSGGAAAPAGGPVPPGRPVPAPAGVPPVPPTSGVARRIVTIVVALLVVGVLAYIGVIRPMIEDRKWVEGACINYYPSGNGGYEVEYGIDPAVVGCSDDGAKARIVGVFGPDATIERDCEPLESFALVARKNATYCIVELGP